MVLKWVNELLQIPMTLERRCMRRSQYAATSHDEVEELVDVEDITEEDNNKPKLLFFWLEGS